MWDVFQTSVIKFTEKMFSSDSLQSLLIFSLWKIVSDWFEMVAATTQSTISFAFEKPFEAEIPLATSELIPQNTLQWIYLNRTQNSFDNYHGKIVDKALKSHWSSAILCIGCHEKSYHFDYYSIYLIKLILKNISMKNCRNN